MRNPWIGRTISAFMQSFGNGHNMTADKTLTPPITIAIQFSFTTTLHKIQWKLFSRGVLDAA